MSRITVGEYEWAAPEEMFLKYCPLPRKRKLTRRREVAVADFPDRPVGFQTLDDAASLDDAPMVTSRHVELRQYRYITTPREIVSCWYAWDSITRTIWMQEPFYEWCSPGEVNLPLFARHWWPVPREMVDPWEPGPNPLGPPARGH